MKPIYIITIIMLAIASSVSAEMPKKGDTAIVPFTQEIMVQNTRAIPVEGCATLQTNDTCKIEEGGILTVQVFLWRKGLLIVEYARPKGAERCSCPDGVLLAVGGFDFQRMTAVYEYNQRERREHAALMESLEGK